MTAVLSRRSPWESLTSTEQVEDVAWSVAMVMVKTKLYFAPALIVAYWAWAGREMERETDSTGPVLIRVWWLLDSLRQSKARVGPRPASEQAYQGFHHVVAAARQADVVVGSQGSRILQLCSDWVSGFGLTKPCQC